MLYFKVRYEAGFYCGGFAYIQALSKEGAKQQCRKAPRKALIQFNLRTLTRVPKEEYVKVKRQSS